MNVSYSTSFLNELAIKYPHAVATFQEWFYEQYIEPGKTRKGLLVHYSQNSNEPNHVFSSLPYEMQYGVLINFFSEQGKIMLLAPSEAKGFFERMFSAVEEKEVYPNTDGELISVGANAIFQERMEQIQKHGYTLDSDKINSNEELLKVAIMLLTGDLSFYPQWKGIELCEKLLSKSMKERYTVAGALIAAHIDLMTEEEKLKDVSSLN